MKTISDHPLLIGRLLARAAARDERRQRRGEWLRRLFGLARSPRVSIARFSPSETVITHRV